MPYRALRGVCIGPGRHLAAGDVAELDTATSQFLTGIGAVEFVAAPAPSSAVPAAPASKPIPPAKSGKKEK